MLVIKPDIVREGKVDEIIEKVNSIDDCTHTHTHTHYNTLQWR